VTRHLLPQLQAMNFVLDEVLDGGVNDALNLDSHGKALAFHLLDLEIAVPEALQAHLAGSDDDGFPTQTDNRRWHGRLAPLIDCEGCESG
jgi:hypothetical protein